MDYDKEIGSDQLTQLYFWGGHGGIGGGDPRQLESSNCTIRFLVEEMQRRGIRLYMNLDLIPEYGDVEADSENIKSSWIMGMVEKVTGKFVRPIENINQVHNLAVKRYQRCPRWRPPSLNGLHDELIAKNIDE